MDLRDMTTRSEAHKVVRKTAIVLTTCLVVFIGSIMLFSWMFAGPYHPPYRPSCQGSGVKQVIDDTHNDGSVGAYTIICNDGFSYYLN